MPKNNSIQNPPFLISQLPVLTICLFTASLTYLYLSHEPQLLQQKWSYLINADEFKGHPNIDSHSVISLEHEGEGEYTPINLTVRTRRGERHSFQLDSINHTHIDERIALERRSIHHAIIDSDHPLLFDEDKHSEIRLLESSSTDEFVSVCGEFFEVLIPLLRNLVVVGLLTNNIDLFLPAILAMESVTLIALLDNQKHYLATFYSNVFNSNLDAFNIIRLNLFASSSTGGLQLLEAFGFKSNIFYNLSGEFLVYILFLMATIFIKAGASLLKFENLRSISSKLRPIWNGLLFCIMPRVLVFSGFSLRTFSFDSFDQSFFPFIAIGFVAMYAIYLVQLFLQIRKINEKVQYLPKSHQQIGLVSRLYHSGNFEFDCLQFSNLYYPIMNCSRIIIFFLPIGILCDMPYISFGGAIAGQLLYVMLSVSSSGYAKTRDSLIYPFCDFLIVVMILAYISVGLAESVYHSEASIIAEQIFFAVLIAVTILILTSLAIDLKSTIAKKLQESKDDKTAEDKDLKTTRFKKTIKKRHGATSGKSKNESKTTVKTAKHKETNFSDEDEDEQDDLEDSISIQGESAVKIKKNMKQFNAKVRKVRKGKLV